jgi:uncharacterized protein (TIGR04141 family)
MAAEKISFSVYLLRAGSVAEVESTLFASGHALGEGLEGVFVPVPAEGREPRWFRAVKVHLKNPDIVRLRGSSPAGMMLVKRPAHAFVLTFGHAWQQLLPRWIELDFGRRVVLNAVPPGKVLEVSSQQIFAKKHLARERAPWASSVTEFGLEYDRDLVAAVEGVPSEDLFGATLRGSLSLRLSIHFPTLARVLDRAAIHFASDEYKKNWPEIDTIAPVSDDGLVQKLDALLDRELISGAAKSKAVLFAPAFLRGDSPLADSCSIGVRGSKVAKSPYLLYGSWERHLAGSKESPSLPLAKKTPVYLFDEDGESIERSTVYECLTYELSHERKQYVLSSGVWHRADDDFVKKVNEFVGNIESPPIALPIWNQVDDEGTYNKSCCDGAMLHFDAKNIPFGGGHSKFEFCDFMHPTERILFFAKIASKSSGCSHLLEQVRRTEELLFGQDGAFRAKLKKAFKKHYPRARRNWLDEKPARGDWKLCLVSLGRDKASLPFFAKCGVRRLVRSLEQLGHTVYFASV